MSVRIRMTRVGRKKAPLYRIVAIDREQKRDGMYLENLGHYNPHTNPATVELNRGAVMVWLEKGATPSETVRGLLQREGLWKEFKGAGRPAKKKVEGGKATTKKAPVRASKGGKAVKAAPSGNDAGNETGDEASTEN